MMHAYLVAIVALLLGTPTAFATTYTYDGGALTYDYYNGDYMCAACSAAGIGATVNFHFNTSHFTGSYTLSAGDTAVVYDPAGLSPASGDLTFPATENWFGGTAGLYGIGYSVNGTFLFQDGKIASWNMSGGSGFIGTVSCGGGPACFYGEGFNSSDASGDSWVEYGYPATFSGTGLAGAWTIDRSQTSSVPEPSTWAMLLIGFCGIGLLAALDRAPAAGAAGRRRQAPLCASSISI